MKKIILERHSIVGFVDGRETRDCLGPTIPGNFVIAVSELYPERINFGGKILQSKKSSMTVAGEVADVINGLYGPAGESNNGVGFKSIILKKNGFYYLISDTSGKTDGVEETKFTSLFNNFLSTFKFTK